MFSHKLRLMALGALLVGGACSLAQRRPAKVAPLPPYFNALKKCELHGTQLKLGTASILYGKRNHPVPQLVEKHQFPRAYVYVMGGCCVSEGSPFLQAVKYCPQCRAAEKRWAGAHKPTNPAR